MTGLLHALSDQELGERVDAGPCESDRAFFRQHPQRNFRLRPAWTAEIEDFARQGVIKRELPSDLCWWVLVHQLVPHKARLRWPLAAPHHYYADPPEKIARKIWLRHVQRAWKKKSRALQDGIARVLQQYGEIS